MEACFYNDFNKYFNDPSYTKPVEKPKTDLLEILSLVANDKRFDSLKVLNTADEGEMLAADPKLEEIMLEYWNSWDLSDPKKQFEESQRAATAVLLGTITDKSPKYDFFLLHSLTGSHAARVLLPLIPSKWHMSLVRQWWLFTLTAYVMQKRPAVDVSRITDYDLKGRDWTYVVRDALEGKHAHDPHYVKGQSSQSSYAANADHSSPPFHEGVLRDLGRCRPVLSQSRRSICGRICRIPGLWRPLTSVMALMIMNGYPSPSAFFLALLAISAVLPPQQGS